MKKPIPFGKYYLLDRVNVGGMAEVFRAKIYGVEDFERLIAIKRILPNIAEDEEFITMFIDEAKIAVQLTHANIAQIYDLGKVDDSYFIALEYVHGKDLRAIWDRLRKKGEFMPSDMAAFIIHKVCEALDYAHRKKDKNGKDLNLVHRDVSPQNILVSYEGEVKVIDFGIAKAARKSTKTQAGILKGKFGYMSPEQVRGLPIDRRSDIFAIGVVLYELVTGERLFVGASDFSTLEKVRNVEIVPPTTYNKSLPKEIEDVILKALAKDTEERYQWASEMAMSLQKFILSFEKPYTGQELANFMKTIFAADIARERKKLKAFDEMGVPEPRRDSEDSTGTQKVSTGSTSYGGAPATSPGTPVPSDSPKPLDVFDPNLMPDAAAKVAPRTPKQIPPPQTPTPPSRTPSPATPSRTPGPSAPTPTPTPSSPGFQKPPHSTSGVTVPYKTSGAGTTPRPTPYSRGGGTNPRFQSPAESSLSGSLELDVSPHELRRRQARSFDEPSYSKPGTAKREATGRHRSSAYVSSVHPPVAPRKGTESLKKFGVILAGVLLIAVALMYLLSGSDGDEKAEKLLIPGISSGTLSVNVFPAIADIYIDGKKVASKSPFESDLLDVGKHKLLIKQEGYKDFEKEIVIHPNDKTQEFVELKPLIEEYGKVEVITKPPGAVITLDGRTLFDTTPYTLEKVVANVKHSLLLSKIGFKDTEMSFKVTANSTKKVEISLDKALVNVTIYSNPSQAVVFREGVKVGTTPFTIKDVPCSKEETISVGKSGWGTVNRAVKPQGIDCETGRMKVTVNLPKDEDTRTMIIPSPGGASPKKAEKEQMGTLDLNSKPWAYIWIDDKELGKTTPLLNYPLPAGEHKIRLFNSDFKFERTFTITIKAGEKSSHQEIGVE
ncbi:MAG: hypothetical protein Kow0090_14630 [Myxococcota bacterium]